jgi:LCP family protein required for cell wall assembly
MNNSDKSSDGVPSGRHRERQIRHSRSPKRSLTKRILAVVVAIVVAVTGTVAGYAWFLAAQFDEATTSVEGVITAAPTPAEPYTTPYAPQNILILGSDSRGRLGTDPTARGNRSDVIMVMHISGDRRTVQIMSIPRDTWIAMPCYGKGKANWAMSYGGVPCAVSMVEGFLDVHIDHFVLIDFSGVKKLTKILGGVTLNNPTAFTSDTNNYERNRYRFEKGEITLEGARALAYVRERHAFSDGDISRVANQQRFVTAVAEKMLSIGLLTDPGKMSQVAAAVGKLLIVDSGLDSGWIVRTATELSPFESGHLHQFTMPIKKSAMVGSQYAILVNKTEMQWIKNLWSRDALSGYIPTKRKKIKALDQGG